MRVKARMRSCLVALYRLPIKIIRYFQDRKEFTNLETPNLLLFTSSGLQPSRIELQYP